MFNYVGDINGYISLTIWFFVDEVGLFVGGILGEFCLGLLDGYLVDGTKNSILWVLFSLGFTGSGLLFSLQDGTRDFEYFLVEWLFYVEGVV